MDSDFKQYKLYFECILEFWEFSLRDEDCEGIGVDNVHKEIEKIIRESPDARNGVTNVKAKMTKWNMLDHIPFKIISTRFKRQ